jgi:hypothetical protein
MSESRFNARYGLDPSTPQDRRDLCELIRVFAPSEGRFIAEYPALAWREAFLSHARSLGDSQHHRAQEALQRLRHALLTETEATAWRSAWSWAENASTLKERLGWADLLGPPGSPATVKIFQELWERPLPTSRGALIPMTARAYVEAARPLLLTSHKLILVDKFFSPVEASWAKRRRVLVELLRALRKGSKVRYLEIRNSSKGEEKSECQTEFDRCNEEAETCKFIEIAIEPIEPTRKSGTGITAHARYLLGNHGGLRFEHGFVEHYPSRGAPALNDVQWLDMTVWAELWEHYG